MTGSATHPELLALRDKFVVQATSSSSTGGRSSWGRSGRGRGVGCGSGARLVSSKR